MYSLERPLLWFITMTISFVLLFHGASHGLNVLLFEMLLVFLVLLGHGRPKTLEFNLSFLGTLLTAVSIVIHGSIFAQWMNLLFVISFLGTATSPGIPSMLHGIVSGLTRIILAVKGALNKLLTRSSSNTETPIIWKRAYYLIPVLIIWLFLYLYRAANPQFDSIYEGISRMVLRYWHMLWSEVDLRIIWTISIGMLSALAILIKSKSHRISKWVSRFNERLIPVSENESGDKPSGKGDLEYRTGLVLFIGLNVLLLLLNILDVKNVWLDFQFQGEYLREFVHSGTYILIFSILLGVSVVLFYFRGHLNFRSKNGLLKKLSYLWLFQNVILCVSLFIRLSYYIHYYALAYKRIGVLIFLLATLIGLFTVYLKVRTTRSKDFLIRWNMVSIFSLLMISSTINWDVLIAKHNFSQKDQSFIHLDFMATLSDKALPYLIKEDRELEEIYKYNKRLSSSFESHSYMNASTYGEHIDTRIKNFLEGYPQRDWREWNFAEWRAYQSLKD